MTVDECRRWLEAFERQHGITYVECLRSEARSNHRTRTSYAQATLTYEAVAVRAHEDFHIVAGACPQTSPHLRDSTERRWWNCLACENLAWELAVRLLPFNREMFRELQRCLGTYRRGIVATEDARQAARSLASDNTYAAEVLRRERRAELESKIRDIELWANSRPVLKRWQRQWLEIQEMTRGIGR